MFHLLKRNILSSNNHTIHLPTPLIKMRSGTKNRSIPCVDDSIYEKVPDDAWNDANKFFEFISSQSGISHLPYLRPEEAKAKSTRLVESIFDS